MLVYQKRVHTYIGPSPTAIVYTSNIVSHLFQRGDYSDPFEYFRFPAFLLWRGDYPIKAMTGSDGQTHAPLFWVLTVKKTLICDFFSGLLNFIVTVWKAAVGKILKILIIYYFTFNKLNMIYLIYIHLLCAAWISILQVVSQLLVSDNFVI